MGHSPGEFVVRFEIPAGQVSFHGGVGIHLRRGEVLSLKMDPCPTRPGLLGAVLVENGAVALGELRFGLAVQHTLLGKNRPVLLGETMHRLGLITPTALDEALRDLALRRLAELFHCSRGRFKVLPGLQLPSFLPIGRPIDHVLLRAAHLADCFGPRSRTPSP
ncbi:MAG: hypothetical protein KAY24_12710 [Candidatus Eisenbacteria sp.]|nr:hypothetical protein [Candidatus Eisenbacteria bacterium]